MVNRGPLCRCLQARRYGLRDVSSFQRYREHVDRDEVKISRAHHTYTGLKLLALCLRTLRVYNTAVDSTVVIILGFRYKGEGGTKAAMKERGQALLLTGHTDRSPGEARSDLSKRHLVFRKHSSSSGQRLGQRHPHFRQISPQGWHP